MMNFKGKNKFYILVTLTLLFIIQIIIYLSFNVTNPQITVVMILLVLIAFVGVLVSYMAIKRTGRRIKKIPDSYKEVYYDIVEIVGISVMNMAQKRNTMNMVLEIFEHASLQNRDVNEVTGGNLEEFMSGFIEVSGGKLSTIYLVSYSTFLFVIYILFIKLYKVIKYGGLSLEAIEQQVLDRGIVLTYLIIAYIFFPWMLTTVKKAATEQWRGIKKALLLIPFLLPLSLVSVLIISDNTTFREFLDSPMPILSSAFLVICALIISVVSFLVMRKYKLKT